MIKKNSVRSVFLSLTACITVFFVIELFLFNSSYVFPSKEVKKVPEIGEGLIQTSKYEYRIVDESCAYLEFTDIDTHISNVYMPLNKVTKTTQIDPSRFPVPREHEIVQDDYALHIVISADDDSHPYGMNLPEQMLHGEVLSSHWIDLHLYGNTKTVRIYFKDSVGSVITFDGPIEFNSKSSFYVNPIRIVLYCCVVAFAIYRLFIKEKNVFCCSKKIAWISVAALSALLSAMAVLITKPWNYMATTNWQADFQYQAMARSLASGHAWIDYPVSKELLASGNPYSLQVRETFSEPTLFDYAYYEGHYYSYFGLLPCIVFFLPYFIFTGQDLSPWKVIFVLSVILAILVVCLVYLIFRKWNKTICIKTQLMVALSAICVVQPTLCLSFHSVVYAVPIIMALVLALSAACLWFYASICNDNKKSVLATMFGGFLAGLIVGCRPQMCAVVVLVPLLLVFAKHKHASISLSIKRLLLYGGSSAICAIVGAIPFLYWNKIRFDIFFEFGAIYQLTNTDQTALVGGLSKIPYAIVQGIFSPAGFKSVFPYLSVVSGESEHAGGYQGFFFSEPTLGGILFWYPVALLLPLLMFKKIRKSMDVHVRFFIIVMLCMSLVPLIVDTIAAAFATRYLCDFGYLLLITVVTFIAASCSNGVIHDVLYLQFIRILCIFSVIAAVWSLFMSGRYNDLASMNPGLFVMLQQTFAI